MTMRNVVYRLRALCVLSVLISGCATTQIAEKPTAHLSSSTGPDLLTLPPFAELENNRPATALMSKSFSLNLGPQVVKLKTSFVEKKEPQEDLNGITENGLSRRYLNFHAMSSSPAGGLITEGEFSYSLLDSLEPQCDCGEEPRMLRLSLKDRWAGFSFGADYKSLGKGFTALTGEKMDQSRDEGWVWGERSLGPLNLRGTVGESWERLTEVNEFRLTKTATTGINFNRARWGGGWVSTFSLVGEGEDGSDDRTVFTQTLTGAYRPVSGLTLGSSLSIKQERNTNTGIKIDTPGAGLTVLYTPFREGFSLNGSTAYTRTFNAGGSSNGGTVDLIAGMNWKLGKFWAKDDVLSFNLKYNRQLDFASPGASQEDFAGMLQLKIFGF
jgi:hypothetical protein